MATTRSCNCFPYLHPTTGEPMHDYYCPKGKWQEWADGSRSRFNASDPDDVKLTKEQMDRMEPLEANPTKAK
jgi:hypothetical protein